MTTDERGDRTEVVRPIEPDDAAALVCFHEALDVQSQYFRFFTAHPHLTEAEVHRFTCVDHRDREALVVLDGDRLVAVGRYERDLRVPAEAEVAFIVAPDHRGRGWATELLHRLAELARRCGIDTFTAETLGVNHTMREVFAHAGYPWTSSFEDGIVVTRLDVRCAPGPRATGVRPPAPTT